MKFDIKNIIKVLLSVFIIGLIIYFAINLFIFLLPVIVVLIIAYYLYRIFVQTKLKKTASTNNKNNNTRIKNSIEEAEVVSEKFDK